MTAEVATPPTRPRLGPLGCGIGLVASVGALLFTSFIVTILLAVAIWPGEVKLVAPLFCSDEQPDPFVVSDTYSVQPGETTTNFTLYCMGPRGDATDHGFMLPFLATMALNTLALAGVLVVVGLIVGLTRRRRRRATTTPGPTTPPPAPPSSGLPPGSTAGPFV